MTVEEETEVTNRIEADCWSEIEAACIKALETWIDDEDCRDIDRV